MEKELTLLTWPDYIHPLTLEQFESEFGVKVTLEIVPSAVELVDRMRAPGLPPDVLIPPDYAVRELSAEGRLMPLDHVQSRRGSGPGHLRGGLSDLTGD